MATLGLALSFVGSIGCSKSEATTTNPAASASAKTETKPAAAAKPSASSGAGAKPAAVGRVVEGTLKGAHGKSAVVAKTKSGKTIPAKVDPKTKKFTLALPDNEAATVAVRSGSKFKQVKFAKNNPAKVKGLDPAKNLTLQIPDEAFTAVAVIGVLDLGAPGEFVIIGDAPGETSIFAFIDTDHDGDSDWDDANDDGDDQDDLHDADFEADDDWVEQNAGFDDEQDFVIAEDDLEEIEG